MGDINAYTPFVEVAKRVDAVINAANSDNAFVVHALLDGLKGTGKTLDPDLRLERGRRL